MKKLLCLLSTTFLFSSLTFSQTDRSIKNLTAFSEAYGYVKYFHPSDEAFENDWNKYAAYGAEAVENCKNDEELVNTLNKIFSPIAPTSKFSLRSNKVDMVPNSFRPTEGTDYDLIYWQHKGVGYNMEFEGKPYNPYKSVRVNKMKNEEDLENFGNLMTSIDPAKYAGKPIKYEGWAKINSSEKGQGQFWIRVDKPDQQQGFFNNSEENPVTKNEWTKFEIEGKVDLDATNLSIGCFLSGLGTLWIDNIALYYKENEQWIEIPIENSDFETQDLKRTRGEKSTWYTMGADYKIELQKIDSPKYNNTARIEYLEKHVQLFDCKPGDSEILEKEIVENIFFQAPFVLSNSEEGTYPKASEKIDLESVSENPENIYCRIGNTINAYNLFKHFYTYFEVANTDWRQDLQIAIGESYSDKNGSDHNETLLKFTAKLKDGHIGIRSEYSSYFKPPIKWEWIENKLVLTKIYDESLDLNVGDIVDKIEGQNPKVYFENVNAHISAGTKESLMHKASFRSLQGSEGSELNIEVNSKKYNLIREKTKYTPKKEDNQDDHFTFYEEERIAYIDLDKITMSTISDLMPKLEKANAIICDLRGYPNDNHAFISHLLKEDDTDNEWMQIPYIIYPNSEGVCDYSKSGWMLKAEKPYLGDKQIIFITNGSAISYAESYMGFIEGYDLATIVGQPTAGANGNVNPFNLSGGYKMYWTGMKVIKHDGSLQHGVGIIPDVRVEKTIQGVKDGRDEFLEKALELIK